MTAPARRIAVCTGTRAEFGLLRSVMRAIDAHAALELSVVAMGAHFLPPAMTIEEVEREFPIAAEIPMQRGDETGHLADAAALGRGVSGVATYLRDATPAWVVVLGDRIEAFAAASAAAVGGVRVAHLHGGDRAQGVADEAMRHAITKLAHMHLPATALSAERICRMGEPESRVHVVGSPAIDDLAMIPPLGDEALSPVHGPRVVFLLHPTGRPDDEEQAAAAGILDACCRAGATLALQPNHDPGHEGIRTAIDAARHRGDVEKVTHMPRDQFIGLLRRDDVTLVGNSSAGLIEAPAIGARVVNIGHRQSGRETPDSVVSVADDRDVEAIRAAIDQVCSAPRPAPDHRYGDGTTGTAVAVLLADAGPSDYPLHKRNTY